MARFIISERPYEVPQRSALLDTNVLVAFVDEEDSKHPDAVAALEVLDYSWVVCFPVLLESWNLLARKRQHVSKAHLLLRWVLTPGNVILIDEKLEEIDVHKTNTEQFRVDLVDSVLMRLADDISRAGRVQPAIHVATFDTGDFLRCFNKVGLKFNVYDMRTLTSTADG